MQPTKRLKPSRKPQLRRTAARKKIKIEEPVVYCARCGGLAESLIHQDSGQEWTHKFKSAWTEQDELDRKRSLAPGWLASAEILYRNTKNSLWVWHAISVCTHLSISLPPWVSTYLYEVSIRLEGLTHAPPKKPADAIAKALKLESEKGQGTMFSTFNDSRKILIAADMRSRINSGEQATFIAEDRDFQRRHTISRAAAMKIWKKYGPMFNSSIASDAMITTLVQSVSL